MTRRHLGIIGVNVILFLVFAELAALTIYYVDTGALFYDSDGTGAAAAIQVAEMSAGLALTHLDFLVV